MGAPEDNFPSFFMVMSADGFKWRTRYRHYHAEAWTSDREKAGVYMLIGQARARATRAASEKGLAPIVVEFRGGEVILHHHDEQLKKYRAAKARKQAKREERLKKFRAANGYY